MIIRRITPKDNFSDFDCGNDELNIFLKRFAKQNQFKHYLGNTFIIENRDILIGYITITTATITKDIINFKLPNYPLPVLRIARLAIDKQFQGKSFGKLLLKFAIEKAIELKDDFGCIGIIVDAKPEALNFYKKFGFKKIKTITGKINYSEKLDLMFLSMKTILRAK
jgi:ribosomal protein S18 acetylase RimI-like enzyme